MELYISAESVHGHKPLLTALVDQLVTASYVADAASVPSSLYMNQKNIRLDHQHTLRG